MKSTGSFFSIYILFIITILGITIFASMNDNDNMDYSKTNMTDALMNECFVFNEEQNIETEAWKVEFDDLKKKWIALTKEQKEEIYKLKDKIIDTQLQIIDKYVEWEIIDKSKAIEMKKRFNESKIKMRENNHFPLPACRSGFDKN